MISGRILEISEEDYEADKFFDDFPTLRSSIAWKLIEKGSTPMHAWHSSPRLNPNYKEDHSRKFDLGKAAHAMLLGKGAEFHLIDADSFMTKAAKQERDEAYTAKKIPLLRKDFEQAANMAEAARVQLVRLVDHGTLERMPFGEGETERVLIWQDRGVWCRCRIDYLPHDGESLNEYKTTAASAHPDLFQYRQIRQLGYDVQLAFYRRGVEACGIATSPTMGIFAQETAEPYLLSYMRLDDELVMRANERIERALKTWKTCLETNTWPGYSLDGYDIELTERERTEMDAAHAANGQQSSHISSDDTAAMLDKPTPWDQLVRR